MKKTILKTKQEVFLEEDTFLTFGLISEQPQKLQIPICSNFSSLQQKHEISFLKQFFFINLLFQLLA